MGKIKKLSGSVINQIAAGEVVIQPCSVIKELVENSLDAGATQVEVAYSGSGADELKVSDNGSGMDPEDLLLSIEAHATSKIQCAEDLYRVVSCGFRGEALASIAEVSHFEIISRAAEAEQAYVLKRNSDGQYGTSKASRSQGTTISMKGLFHNVPVRRRFLKSDRAESSANLEIMRKLALARPWVAISVVHDGNQVIRCEANQTLTQRCKDLELFEKNAQFLEFDREDGCVKVHGLVVAPPDHFGNGQKIHLYVNRRPIKDKALAQALVRAFASYIPEKRFPGGVVFIELDPEEVDVNIHPTKSEVRFREADLIFKKVYAAVRDVLVDSAQTHDASEHTSTMVYKTSGLTKTVPMNRNYGGVYEQKPNPFNAPPDLEVKAKSPIETTLGTEWQPRFPSANTKVERDKVKKEELDVFKAEPELPQVTSSAPSKVVEALFAQRKLPKAVQLLNRFILLEHDDHIELMDQHAIHERILFNQLAHEDRHRSYSSQMLLSPVLLKIPENLIDVREAIKADFESMGFQLELIPEKQCLKVSGIPDFLKLEKALVILEGIFDELSMGAPPDRDQLRRSILHSAACRAAIKAGDRLSEDELQGLVAATLTMDLHQGCCPHGRNARWRISIAEANAMFNR